MKMKKATFLVLLAFVFNLSFQGPGKAQSKGSMAPDFALPTTENTTIALAQYKGNRNIFIMFWKINGLYCPYELEGLRDRYQELKKNDFEVIAVNIKEQKAKVQDFSSEKKLPFPVLLDADGKVAGTYEITGLPVMLIIDKKGEIKWRGYRFPEGYQKYVE